ncbi:MAG: 30S ribosomal protein S15 [Anaerolineales bacterium]|nr:30S ribosomal protein S15 [Anaerolineales bacterium]QYK50977.1 MAG: 30S ribosomal protein S15 [Anaerolineales bacterium]
MPLAKDKKDQIIGDYRRAEGDTGSTEVQIALLTSRIEQLTAHGQTHKKDVASRRGLVKLVGQRRRLLNYLRNRDYDAYVALADRLSIRRKTK